MPYCYGIVLTRENVLELGKIYFEVVGETSYPFAWEDALLIHINKVHDPIEARKLFVREMRQAVSDINAKDFRIITEDEMVTNQKYLKQLGVKLGD
jgi:hypothetical protein